jgi:hypothetical protein
MHIQNAYNNTSVYICTGTWQITDGPGGKADFTPSQADMTTGGLSQPGLFMFYPVVTLSTGPVAMDPQLIRIISSP